MRRAPGPGSGGFLGGAGDDGFAQAARDSRRAPTRPVRLRQLLLVRILRVPAAAASRRRTSYRERPQAAVRHRVLSPRPNPRWSNVANSDAVVVSPTRTADLVATGKRSASSKEFPGCTTMGGTSPSHPWQAALLSSARARTSHSTCFPSRTGRCIRSRAIGRLEGVARLKPLGRRVGYRRAAGERALVRSDGKNMKIVATGLRNCQAIASNPRPGNCGAPSTEPTSSATTAV